jgi:predicted ATPase
LIQNQSSRRLSPGGQQLSQYRFRHILFQKYLYNSLDDAECTYLHEAVGQVLERLYDDQTEDIAVQLARHFEAAGWSARAVEYLQQAGDRAVHLSANEEALAHFSRALALLEALPATPERNRRELSLQIAHFAPLAAFRGYAAPELGQAYARARELCRLVDDAPRLFVVTYGLWGHNLVRMNLDLAREFSQQCLALAQASQDPAHLLEANRMMGETAIHRGELVPARRYFERSRALYDPERHHAHAWVYGQDPGVALLSHGSWTLWHLGYADQALAWSREARGLAQAGSHPFSTAFAEEYASILYQLRGENQASLACAETVITLGREQRFAEWLRLAESSRAWILVETGDVNDGIAQLRQGLGAHRATGSEMFASYYLTLLARAYMCAGQADAARAVLDEALAVVERTEGRLWEAEIYRLRGELLLSRDGGAGETEAEAWYLKGLAIARLRQARSLELRAVMSLCRLWQRPGKIAEARQLLTETYNWFTEGFDTADLREARALLEALV